MCHLIIIDLKSVPAEYSRRAREIMQSGNSNYTIGISDDQLGSSENSKGKQETDLDYFFSLDADPEEFLRSTTEFAKE